MACSAFITCFFEAISNTLLLSIKFCAGLSLRQVILNEGSLGLIFLIGFKQLRNCSLKIVMEIFEVLMRQVFDVFQNMLILPANTQMGAQFITFLSTALHNKSYPAGIQTRDF